MLSIQSSRLQLIPLTHEQLQLGEYDMQALEQALGLNPSSMHYDDLFIAETANAMQNYWLPNTLLYPDLYPWYTNWKIVLKEINTIIGSIGLSGYPDDHGETIVGYGISKPYQGNGYASEALQRLLQWGYSFSLLKAVNADTTKDNTASQKVLLKNGFRQTGAGDQLLYYKHTKY